MAPDESEPPPRVSTRAARKTVGPALKDTEPGIDMAALRAYRLGRVREQLKARDIAAAVLFDPVNIRYATATRNMAVWTLHNAARYAFVAADGPVVMFDFHNSAHLSEGLGTVDEVRPARSWFYFAAGPNVAERARTWAGEIAELVRVHGGGSRRVALDHCDPPGADALRGHGLELTDGQEVLERARCIKSAEEIACMGHAIAVAEAGMAGMREALKPGLTENELWAILQDTNTRMGGEWIETRLLASGGRTNPWFQEASDRVIRAGELVAYDTDMVGPFGYCADVSRTHFCGPGRPSAAQKELYSMAYDQVQTNMGLLRPGLTFREFAERGYRMPERCRPNRYSVQAHGVGFCDEYPHCAFLDDIDTAGYDGVFESGMVVCVESYMGEVGGEEGVKLEEQVLITEDGIERLSTFPYEDDLLTREV